MDRPAPWVVLAVLLVAVALLALIPGGQPGLAAPLPAPALLTSSSHFAPAPSRARSAPATALNSCPNANEYGNGIQLSLQNTVDCAGGAGFTGNLEITFVSMAYQESTFCAGAIESGSGTCMVTSPGCGSSYPDAEGILQEGTAGQCPPAGGSFAVGSYSPSTCSTYGGSSDWGGIYFNPTCSFQWALAYYNANGYAFWGSYLSGAYCKWAPVGFAGTGSMLCDSANGYPSGGENLSGLPWGTVCPGNVCGSTTTPLSASYAMKDLTTSASLSCGGTFEAGDQIQFTGQASGGTAPYNYSWTFGDGTGGYGSPVTHVYKAAGTVNPLLTVTDQNGSTAPSGSGCSFTVTAAPQPSISSFIASPASFALGGTTDLNVTATGGSPGYTYAYSSLPSGCASANVASLACTPSGTGSSTVTVTVTDTRLQTVSSTVTITVNPASGTGPTISSFTASPSSIPLGGTTYLNVTASGGTGPLTYAYAGLPSPCASANSSAITCAPAAAGGPYAITVTVSDSAATPHGTTATASFTVTSSGGSGPTISAFTASPASIPVGGTTYLNVTASGGTGPLTYSYAGLPSACVSVNLSKITCSPSTAGGPFTVMVSVSDSAPTPHTTSATAAFTVTPAGGGSGPSITSFTASPSTVPAGGTTYLNVSASGGVGPLTYAYTGLPTACPGANQSRITCSTSTAATYTATVRVSDSAATPHAVSASVSFVVTTVLPPQPSITSFSVQPSTVTEGTGTNFTTVVSGGLSPLTYAYTGLPSGCPSANSTPLHCVPAAVGHFAVLVTVTDAAGRNATASTTLTVDASTTPLTISSFLASAASLPVGSTVTFNVTAAGGAPPLTYAYSGLPAGCSSGNVSSLPCVPSHAGNFSVTVRVTDVTGRNATASVSITVDAKSSPPPSPSTSNALPTSTLFLVVALVVVAIAVVAVLLLRRRPRAPEPSPAAPTYGADLGSAPPEWGR